MQDDRQQIKELPGITQNSCFFQGKVIGNPTVVSDNYAYMFIRTIVQEQGQNGAWVEVAIDVPIITTDPAKVNVLRKYIEDGREVLVEAYYTTWMAQNVREHGFMIKRLVLGRKKFIPRQQK